MLRPLPSHAALADKASPSPAIVPPGLDRGARPGEPFESIDGIHLPRRP